LYVPKHYGETDLAVLHALIEAHPLGAWVAPGGAPPTPLVVNHLPFLVDRGRGRFGTLVGHVARANPVWRGTVPGAASVVIFQGPEGYVSPSWYASKREHGRVVPTWDYAVVHAHGVVRIVDDTAWLRDLVERLTAKHEAGRREPWQVTDAPGDYIARRLEAIVGVEMPIERLEGKWKMSQKESEADRRGVAEGLRAERGDAAEPLARLIEKPRSS
jgi:transcriptional regulator